MILVVGATGQLGSRIATRLVERGEGVRALVRPDTDATPLETTGVEVVRGDLRDVDSVRRATTGVRTVVTTATAIGRALAGDRSATIEAVDLRGNANLIEAAEAAGVERFVFLSFRMTQQVESSPLGAAKRATEQRLARSSLREVIVRADMFQEVWLSKIVGLDWESGKAQIFGNGETPNSYVAVDDVAEGTVRLALHHDPPREVLFGAPQPLTRKQIVERFERATQRKLKRRHIPRAMLRAGSTVLRRVKPVQASLMALSLYADTESAPAPPDDLRSLGVEPKPASTYIDDVTRAA